MLLKLLSQPPIFPRQKEEIFIANKTPYNLLSWNLISIYFFKEARLGSNWKLIIPLVCFIIDYSRFDGPLGRSSTPESSDILYTHINNKHILYI